MVPRLELRAQIFLCLRMRADFRNISPNSTVITLQFQMEASHDQ